MADISKIKLPSGTTYNIRDINALPLTGGSVTGPVSFGDSVSIDEATVGDLVVNGSASFTNNIQANTINGVEVGSNPKFTDTNTVTTATTTGSGNAVTAVTASNGALTITKGTTFLTSHQDISGKADKATTLAGYGITDAKIASGTITLGSNTITPLTSSSTLNAAKLSGAIPSAVTATTQASTDNSTKIATTAYVTTAIANLPEPMVFKGSVGTGGTVTSLPTAAASNEGWTYKVITALSSPAANVGDTVISNGSSWVVIPSGDEPSGTVTSIGVSNATNGGLTISGSPITSSGTVTIGHSNVLSSAQTTQAVYPIKIDKNGHISAYGSALNLKNGSTSGSLKGAETGVTSTPGKDSLAIGYSSEALGFNAVAMGYGSYAKGNSSFALGVEAIANRSYQTVIGIYNETDTTGSETTEKGAYSFIIGNGTNSNTRSNALTVDWNGNEILAGKLTVGTIGTNSMDVATVGQIPTVPSSTGSKVTGITASTTATKTTLGTAFTIPNVTSAGSASTWAFEDIACDDITSWSAGSGSASISGAVDSSDSTQLNITISHTHTAPTLQYTARTVSSKKSGANGSAPTLGTAFTVPNVTGNTSATVSITDPGHTHSI